MKLIDADALIGELHTQFFYDGRDRTRVYAKIQDQPTIEPKKGKWKITDAYPHNVHCSECHKKYAQTQWAVWEDGSLPRNYCPNCGADMRGEQE